MTKRDRLKIGFLAASLVCVTSACVQAPPNTPRSTPTTITPTTMESVASRLLNEARGSVYRVRSVACLAVGTSFATDGVIVTNRHVASGSSGMQLSTWDGNDLAASVSAIASGPDLALLGHAPKATPTITLAPSDPAAGTPVWVTGYPEGNQLSALSGQITDYISGTPYGQPGQIMEISNAIEPGNSGSPLLDASGQVVGVAFALSKLDGAGLAIPVSTLQSFLSNPGTNSFGQCDESGSSGSSGNSGNSGTTGSTGNTGNT